MWKSQVWFTKLILLLVDVPVLLPRKANLLHHPLQTDNVHLIVSHSHLAACRLSGKSFKIKAFQRTLSMILPPHGVPAHDVKTPSTCESCVLSSTTKRSRFAVSTNCVRISANYKVITSSLSYNSLSVARPALTNISFTQRNTISIGGHPVICQYHNGIFNAPPSVKQSLSTWNPITVLQYPHTWSTANRMSLKPLSYKLMMLMPSITGQRGQTVIACRVDHKDLCISHADLWLSATLKTSNSANGPSQTDPKTLTGPGYIP